MERENLNFTIEKFLEARELRVEKQSELMKKYSLPLMVVRANYPGPMKNEYPAHEIVEAVARDIKNILRGKIVFEEHETTLEGRLYTAVSSLELTELKKKMIYLEEKHPLGRFVDIDVYGDEGHSISRTDLGYGRRRCYICDMEAVVCTRAQTHTLEELKRHILKGYERYLLLQHERESAAQELGEAALKSCILELSCHPSFGLVSPITQGSHRDMDYFTFLESSFAIKKGLTEMAFHGYSYMDIHDVFRISRRIGIESEREMFRATGGINTHKGMIFLLGICVQSTAKIFYEKIKGKKQRESHVLKDKIFHEKKDGERNFQKEFSKAEFYGDIQKNIMEICKDLTADFDLIPQKVQRGEKLTNGEKLYLDHGFLGIRGEVRDGLKVVFEESLPYFETLLEEGEELNTAMVMTLLRLMSRVEDSTVVNRKGVQVLRQVQEEAEGLLKNFSLENARKLERKYIEENISPGGSADLLAVTLYLHNSYEILRKSQQ